MVGMRSQMSVFNQLGIILLQTKAEYSLERIISYSPNVQRQFSDQRLNVGFKPSKV